MIIISNRQFAFIVIIFISSTADIFLPSIMTKLAGRDAWLSIIVAALAASVIVLIQARLVQCYPGEFSSQYTRKILGPYLGNLIIFLYIFIFFLLFITLAIIGELIQISGTVFLRTTPEIVLTMVISLAAAYAVFLGIEIIARMVEFAFIPGILIRLAIITFVVGDLQVNQEDVR